MRAVRIAFCYIALASALAYSICACGGMRNLTADTLRMTARLAQECPAGLDSLPCAVAADRVREALDALDVARRAPSDAHALAAAVAVDNAVHAVDALRPATVDAGH